jgi:hypothetical protein
MPKRVGPKAAQGKPPRSVSAHSTEGISEANVVAMSERDIRDILRERPTTIAQVFTPTQRVHLLCPPGTNQQTFERAKIAFGPFTASALIGFVSVTIPARMDEAQDLWDVVMRDAMPEESHRQPGGEPLPTIRTASLGWRLLALLGGAVEVLAAISSAVHSWREIGQPTGLECPLAQMLLTYQTRGATSTKAELGAFGEAASASRLLGYPSEAVLRRYIGRANAARVAARCDRSSRLVADVFSVAASVTADPFWRTFVKWKHGSIATSPGAGPVWITDTPDLDVEGLERRLETGIVVFDAQHEPTLYVWPTERVDLVAYSTMTMHFLQLAQVVAESVLGYVGLGGWPISLFEIDKDQVPRKAERAALDALKRSQFPIAALGGLWSA